MAAILSICRCRPELRRGAEAEDTAAALCCTVLCLPLFTSQLNGWAGPAGLSSLVRTEVAPAPARRAPAGGDGTAGIHIDSRSRTRAHLTGG